MKTIEKINAWFRKNIPITPDDKTQHQNLAEYLIVPLSIWFVVAEQYLYGLIWIGIVNLLAIIWEIPQIKRGEWKESLQDYLMTFKASFGFFVILIYLYTR